MTRLPVFLLILFALFAATGMPARADSLTWPLTANPLPNAPVGNLMGLPEVIGPGPAPQMVLFLPYAGGQRFWVGTTGWIMGPMDTTRYLQFDAAPASGYNFTVTDVSFNYGDDPLTTDFNTLNSQVYYSVDNWTSPGTPLTTNPLAYLNTSVSTFSRSGLNVPVPNGQKFSLRIYPYAIKNSVAMTPTFAIHSNVVIAGRTEPAGGGGDKTGKLCVFKFHDTNGNGKQEPGEQPLAGWVFEVRDASGAVVATLTTDGKGTMCTELPAGNYTVVEQPQPGYTPTTPMNQTVTVTAGQHARARFGNRKGGKTGKLCVYKFHDTNGNGKQEPGEQPLAGWVFEVRDASGAVVATLTTDGKGTMCTELPAGNYTVVEQPQPGYTATTPMNQTVTVTAGQQSRARFGNRKGGGGGKTGKLCVDKFHDTNGNGKQEPGEQPLAGWVFEVRDASGAVVATLTTDGKGTMCTELPAGNYTVVEQPQPGYTATTPMNQTVTVTAGQQSRARFGNRKGGGGGDKTGKLCVDKFYDENGDGKRGPGEPPMEGFVFQVRDASGNVVATLTTNAQGTMCTGLPAGSYTVVELPQAGYTATTSTNQAATVTSGQETKVTFGNRKGR